MSRLYDQVMARGINWPKDVISSPERTGRSVVIDASNVARYYFDLHDKARWTKDDFPNVVPPFDTTFVEFGGSSSPVMLPGARTGIFFYADDLHEFAEKKIGGINITPMVSRDGAPVPYDLDEVRWSVGMYLVQADTKSEVPTVMASFFVELSPNGELLKPDGRNYFMGTVHTGAEKGSEDFARQMALYGRSVLYPCLLAVSFMHCKNVRQELNEPPEKASRKNERNHGYPLTNYYTLEIDPMRRVLRDEGGAERNGLKQALHICRGHFKTYTEEKPLFGKRTGTYWWPQTVRGSKAAGEVVKDYAVKPGGRP